MDETGHSGDTGSAESGPGGEPRDRPQLNGWDPADRPWSNGGAALDPAAEVPDWRRPSTEIRPFTRRPPTPEPPSGEVRPFADRSPAGLNGHTPSGLGDRSRSGEARDGQPLEAPRPDNTSGPGWSSGRARYSDLLAHLSPNGNEPARPPTSPPSLQPGPVPTGPPESDSHPLSFGSDPLVPGSTGSDPLRPAGPTLDGPSRFASRPDSLQADDERRTSELRAIDAPSPSSAPPYPYEGDLDDAARPDVNDRPPVGQQRAAVPLSRPFPAVRPATPGGRRVDWTPVESARHALEPNSPAAESRQSAEPGVARPSYDPASFPRRLPYEPPAPAGSTPPPTAYSGFGGWSTDDPGPRPAEHSTRALPQRVPAEPDVPTVPQPPAAEPPAETPALARIATHLRRGDVPSAQERQEGFDVKAILGAVKEVEGVRDASLRTTPAGAHSLRLDLAEGADPAEVSRQVARLLQDRMGLDAAMQGGEAPPGAFVPSQSIPTARVPPGVGSPGAGRLPPSSQAGWSPAGTLPVTERPEVSGPNIADLPAPATEPAYFGRPATYLDPVPTSLECGPPRPLDPGERPGPRVVIENVQVNTFGTEATVEVRLAVGGRVTAGIATGPAVDGYLLRLCAMATSQAVDELLSTSNHADGPARCFVEHAASVPFGPLQVAVVVLLLSCGGWVEQLAGSAVVAGDDRHAMVRATLAAVNRRLEALLSG